jgi:hypothetical protein
MGMITGLHSTFVFSLMTVYGRTAIGMGWDKAFQTFFQDTQAVRHRGFRSFRLSLHTFLIQMLFLIVSRLPPSKVMRRMGGSILALVMWKVVYCDTKMVIDKAGGLLFHEKRNGDHEKVAPSTEGQLLRPKV